jgi:flagellar hook-basal body complex protein FliE
MMNAVSSIDLSLDKLAPSAGTSSVRASAPVAVSGAGAAPTVDFMDVLSQVSSKAVNTMKAGEAASIQGIEGKMSVQQVVEAVMSAEKTLQTALAVRDKVVSAYQEISRMAI